MWLRLLHTGILHSATAENSTGKQAKSGVLPSGKNVFELFSSRFLF
jgi:hypothetical protein